MSADDFSEPERPMRHVYPHDLAYLGPDFEPAYAGVATGARPRPDTGLLTTDEAYDRLAGGVGVFLRRYVRTVDRVNQGVGLFAMYLLFFMMAVLTYAMISNVVFKSPASWVMEMAQFTMAAYYLLGGGFTFQDDAHVRMDVFRARWSPRTQYIVDAVSGLFVLFYMGVLLHGAVSSSLYALEYGQRNFTAWGPPMAPIKIIMAVGILLMTLQIVARLIRDIAGACGKELR